MSAPDLRNPEHRPPLVYKFSEAAPLIGVSERTFHRWAQGGSVPVVLVNGKRRVRAETLREAVRMAEELGEDLLYCFRRLSGASHTAAPAPVVKRPAPWEGGDNA